MHYGTSNHPGEHHSGTRHRRRQQAQPQGGQHGNYQRPPMDGWSRYPQGDPAIWNPPNFAPPPFLGKGPKGYVRSDERIREDVCDRLSAGYLDASDIEVSVHKGEVTLAGTVSDRRAKRMAADLADGVPGVKDVELRLRIRGEHAHGAEHRASAASADPIRH